MTRNADRTARRFDAALALFYGATTEGEAAAARAACERIDADRAREEIGLDLDSAWRYREADLWRLWVRDCCGYRSAGLTEVCARYLWDNAERIDWAA